MFRGDEHSPTASVVAARPQPQAIRRLSVAGQTERTPPRPLQGLLGSQARRASRRPLRVGGPLTGPAVRSLHFLAGASPLACTLDRKPTRQSRPLRAAPARPIVAAHQPRRPRQPDSHREGRRPRLFPRAVGTRPTNRRACWLGTEPVLHLVRAIAREADQGTPTRTETGGRTAGRRSSYGRSQQGPSQLANRSHRRVLRRPIPGQNLSRCLSSESRPRSPKPPTYPEVVVASSQVRHDQQDGVQASRHAVRRGSITPAIPVQ